MFYDSLYIRRRLEWSRSSLDLVNTLIHHRLHYFLSPFKDPSVTLTRVALSETTNTLQHGLSYSHLRSCSDCFLRRFIV